jgi:hypothetical protein
MARPQIVVNGGTAGVKGSVAVGATVTLTLESTIGVRSVVWSVLSTDETSSVGSYTLAASGSVGQTATFTSGAAGTALIVQVVVNNGLTRGRTDPSGTTNTVKVYVPTSDGREVGAVGETFESDATFGTTALLNAPIRSLASLSALLSSTPAKIARVSATANLALSGIPSSGDTDSVTVVAGDIVLALGQSTGTQNGLWTVAAGAWTRPLNWSAASAGDLRGSMIAVIAGTVRAGFVYQLTNTVAFTVDTSTPTFSRLPDRFDRADLALASSTPANNVIAKYNASSQLVAPSFVSNAANPATAGLLRAPVNSIAVAFRNAANGGDLQAVTADASDNLTIGGAAWQSVTLSVDAARAFLFQSNAVDVFRWNSAGLAVGATATFSLTHSPPASGAGADCTIAAQTAFAGAGGTLNLKSGEGVGGSAGSVRLNAGIDGDFTGTVLFAGGVYGDYLSFLYDNNTIETVITETASGVLRIDSGSSIVLDTAAATIAGEVFVESGGVGFFSVASLGGATDAIFVKNAAVAPGSNPTGGFLMYAEGGAAKVRGSSGTTTTFGPAEPHCPTCGRDFAHEWRNEEKEEHLAVCMPCMLGAMGNAGFDVSRFAFVRTLKPGA